MVIYFSILGLMLLSIFAVVVLPILVVVFFVGLAGLAAVFAKRGLNIGWSRDISAKAVDCQVSAETVALARSIRLSYGAGHHTGPALAAAEAHHMLPAEWGHVGRTLPLNLGELSGSGIRRAEFLS
jgi:hypothetical protein